MNSQKRSIEGVQTSSQIASVNKEVEDSRGLYLQLLKNIDKEIKENNTLEEKQEKELSRLQQTLDDKMNEENCLRQSFQDFRQSIVSKSSNTDVRIVELEQKESLKLAEIGKARMLFLETKLQVKKLEKKSEQKEAYCNGIDEIGFEQMQASFEDKKRKNKDREQEIIRYKSMEKEYIDEFNSEEKKLNSAELSLKAKKEQIKQIDNAIQMRQKNKDRMLKKLKKGLLLNSDVNAVSRELVELNHLKSDKEIDALKAEVKSLKERHAMLLVEERQAMPLTIAD